MPLLTVPSLNGKSYTHQAKIAWNERECLSMNSTIGRLRGASRPFFSVALKSMVSRTNSPGSRTGRVFSNRAWVKVKTAVFAPIPNERVRMEIRAKQGGYFIGG